MSRDPLGRFADDLDEVAGAIADHSSADRALSEDLAASIRGAAPVASGYLAGSVSATEDGVEVAAVYAGVIDQGWPARNIRAAGYIDSGLDGVDLAQPYVDHADDALDHLRRNYR